MSNADPWTSSTPLADVEPVASFPTRTGHTVRVLGPDALGYYHDHCTGCDSRSWTEDIPRNEAEDAARNWAAYHARHCQRLSFGPFNPTRHDMEAEHYGLLINPLDPEYGDGHLIAVGPDLTVRRAIAAMSAYMRTYDVTDQRHALLERSAVGGLVVIVTPTRFIRGRHGWTASPNLPGSEPAAWLVPPGTLTTHR